MAKEVGTIVWHDLTIPYADEVKEFYRSVIGWTAGEFDMGGYSDYAVATPGTDETVAGICHARGDNASLPPQWIVYIQVKDLDASLEACRANGGELLSGPRKFGGARFCILKDPAGAPFAIIEGESGF